MKKIISVISFLILFGCNSGENNTETISKIYVHELLAREQFGGNYKLYKENFAEILKKYGHTKESYNKALNELGTDAEKWEAFFDQSLIYLNQVKASADSSRH